MADTHSIQEVRSDTGDRLVLHAGDVCLVVDAAAGGRMASLRIGDLDLIYAAGAAPFHWGCFPMAPYTGRVPHGRFSHAGRTYALPPVMPPHAMHGTTYDRPWRLEAPDRLAVDLGPAWPFRGRALQQLTLTPDSLTATLSVESVGDTFPAAIGWHPWFLSRLARGGLARLGFSAEGMYVRDEDFAVDGRLTAPTPPPWDDSFVGAAQPITVLWPEALRLNVTADTDHWVVYNRLPHAFCVEPISGPPDALNRAPRLVTPDQPLSLRMTLSWQRL